MTTLIIRRILLMIPMLILMSVVILSFSNVPPGDVFFGTMYPYSG
ncbi:peptide ABC transporter permease, partial [Staphylococcus pseudintermedius]